MKTALCLGGASCLEKDVADFHAMGVPYDVVIACNDAGYRGRIGVYDIVEVDDELRAAIDRGATETEMRRMAEARGTTLMAEALSRVAEGTTDFAEIDRVLGSSL